MAHDLSAGLWLEDREVRLRWRASPADLLAAAPPDISTTNDGETVFVWNGQVWGRLRCQVTTSFGGKWRPQSALLGIRITFFVPEEGRLFPFPSAFQCIEERLAARFGPPASVRDDGEFGESIWRIDNLTLRHEYFNGMGGGHYVYLFVQE